MSRLEQEKLSAQKHSKISLPVVRKNVFQRFTQKSKPQWLLPKPQQFRAARTAGESSSVNCLSVSGFGGRSNCYGARPERESQ